MKAYQYSLLRYRRSKSAGERVNIGLVMAVPSDNMVLHFITPKYGRLSSFFGDFESKGYKAMIDELRDHFVEVLRAEEGSPDESRQLNLGEYVVTRDYDNPAMDKLRPKLLPDVESCFQWSHVMSGIHPKPEKRFQELRYEFIDRHEDAKAGRDRRNEDVIERFVLERLRESKFAPRLSFDRVLFGRREVQHTFPVAWENGVTQVLDAISFDYLHKKDIEQKANTWCGTLLNLSANGADFRFTAVVAPPPDKALYSAYDNACNLISDMKQTRDVVPEAEIDRVESKILAVDLG